MVFLKDKLSYLDSFIPDQLDKSVATILSRYSKHGDYTFTSTDYYWSTYYLIQQMQQFHKLDGYYGFTATYSMKIVWNSDPFIQGIYMLAYLPPYYRDWETDRKSTRLNSSHRSLSRMPSSA